MNRREIERARELAAEFVESCDELPPYGTIEDGFGSVWSRCAADCGLGVTRPGSADCYRTAGCHDGRQP